MIKAEDIVRRYINNIKVWESVSDLDKCEQDFIDGQHHACEKILECINNDMIPFCWPEK